MIARLTGTLAEIAADSAVLDVAGVGYLVLASSKTLTAIGPVGGDVMLFTELQVREESMTLFGFGSQGERDWFRLLTGVQGVGGRVALAILSILAPAELAQAITRQDKAMVARASGVGPKLAERIVRELKDKGGTAIGGVCDPAARRKRRAGCGFRARQSRLQGCRGERGGLRGCRRTRLRCGPRRAGAAGAQKGQPLIRHF